MRLSRQTAGLTIVCCLRKAHSAIISSVATIDPNTFEIQADDSNTAQLVYRIDDIHVNWRVEIYEGSPQHDTERLLVDIDEIGNIQLPRVASVNAETLSTCDFHEDAR